MTARRILVLVLGGALTVFGARALTAFFGSRSQAVATVACLTAFVIVCLWPRATTRLTLLTALTGLLLALILARISSLPNHAHYAGLVLEQTSAGMRPEIAFAFAGLAFEFGLACAWLSMHRRQPWLAVGLAGGAFLLRADVSASYASALPAFVAGALALVVVAQAGTVRQIVASLPALALALGLLPVTWSVAAVSPGSFHLSDPISHLGPAGQPQAGVDQLSLAGPFRPSRTPVMTVRVDRGAAPPYWRGSVFDRYDGRSWQPANGPHRSVASGDVLINPTLTSGPLTVARVHLLQPAQDIFSPGPPLRVSVTVESSYAAAPDQVNAVQTGEPMPRGITYAVEAATLSPDVAPDRLNLQLPALPARVRTLARRLVAGKTTTVGMASAIQSYLRESQIFRYDASAGSPSNRDAVDDFLFHSHRGYCNQFATSMVVLARVVGIPARLVTGYTAGSNRGGVFLVREQDAHSWPELFIPGSGWTAFEPTPGFSAPGGQAANPPPPSRQPRTSPFHNPPLPFPRSLPPAQHPVLHRASPSAGDFGALLLFPILALAVVLLVAVRTRTLSVSSAYTRMVRLARFRGQTIEPGETPLEFAERFYGRPEYEPVCLIARLYAEERYGSRPASNSDIQNTRRAWVRLRRAWLLPVTL